MTCGGWSRNTPASSSSTPHRISEVRSAALTRQLGDLCRSTTIPPISFDDVVGGEAVKAAVQQAQREGRFTPLALVGPPGVGKTMLGKAAARELGLPIAYVDSRLKGGIVGETARNLARLREMLIAYAPVVAFWDEIDLLLGRSTDYNGDSGASNEVRQAILTLLQDAPVWTSSSSRRATTRCPPCSTGCATGSTSSQCCTRPATTRSRSRGWRPPSSASPSPRTRPTCSLNGGDVLWNGRDIARMIASARSNVLRLGGPRAQRRASWCSPLD